jgi:hypothetical protein
MDLRIEFKDGCLFATLSGPHSLSETLELFKRVFDVAAERGLEVFSERHAGLNWLNAVGSGAATS